MAIAIQCANCAFIFGFEGDGIEYAGALCPQCHTLAPRVWVEVDLASRPTQRLPRETVPALIDALDVALAIWIGQAMLDDP